MGGEDKGLLALDGMPLAARAAAALAPQCAGLLVNANRNRERYRALGHPLVADPVGAFWGPLAGVLGALETAPTDLVLTAPCDAPFPPPDLAARLLEALEREGAELAAAHDGTRTQPLFGLLRRELAAPLRAWLEAGGRGVEAWQASRRRALADCADVPEGFVNLNRPEDLAAAAARWAPR
jgi:molybdopterin-guanine dinucleotide biosynthesis protein A